MERLTTKRNWADARANLSEELGYSHIWKRLNLIENILGDNYDIDRLQELIQANDVAPVSHGKWTEVQKENIWGDIIPVFECSLCGKYTFGTKGITEKSNYCPNCGARMDEEEQQWVK